MGVQGLGEVGERVLVGWVRSDRMDVRYVLLILITGQTCLATQPEAEQVSLSGVYNFLTDDLVARRFYVQIIAQVIITIKTILSHSPALKVIFSLHHLINMKLCLKWFTVLKQSTQSPIYALLCS